MQILVTGGLGFIGSHTCVELLNDNHNIIVVDNLSNCSIKVKDKIEQLAHKRIIFYQVDIRDKDKLDQIFAQYHFDLVIHFAGLKAVKESISRPLLYYQNNIVGTLNLLELMQKYKTKNIMFSSSATVYGKNQYPANENSQTGDGITNPYGQTKYIIEQILKDWQISQSQTSVIILRYFNPVGAHPSGLIGENPKDIPNNLFPHILKQKLTIFGNDYDTPDGTCIRDYIHVVDLARGHVAAMKLVNHSGYYVYNLGTGQGTSILEFIQIFEKVNHVKVDYKVGNRRAGDLPNVYAQVDKAKQELGWECQYSLEDVCLHGYEFYRK